MTERTWTQSTLREAFPTAKNLGDIIAAAETQAKLEGVVVCEIRANGLRLTEAQEGVYKDTALSEIQTFSVKTQQIDNLLDESLDGCCEYLAKIAESLEKASVLFRDEDLSTAHKYYKNCTEGVQLFIEMLTHYKIVYQRTRGELPFDWKTHETKLLHTLGQILDAYRKKNYILVADLLEYDLIDVLNVWRQELMQLERSQRRDSGAEPSNEIQT
jgi:hypothetical protein